eukprot:2289339-Rhodomonas_salina.3
MHRHRHTDTVTDTDTDTDTDTQTTEQHTELLAAEPCPPPKLKRLLPTVSTPQPLMPWTFPPPLFPRFDLAVACRAHLGGRGVTLDRHRLPPAVVLVPAYPLSVPETAYQQCSKIEGCFSSESSSSLPCARSSAS